MKKSSLSSRATDMGRHIAEAPVEMASHYNRHEMNKAYGKVMYAPKKRGTRGKKSKSY